MAKAKTAPPPTPQPAPAEYTVVARRYRPQQFADLIGQEHVASALVNALQSNRVAHAYLFTGARGVGKTSAARILAKALNCVKGPTPTPCDECDSCKAVAVGEDMDVVEIDGASNRGIDDARGLRQNIAFRPTRSRFKIYIIDEVHMLTKEAFNALLKTLEEPPEHVKFIFATTEVQKIPITILSRCQRFDFANVGPGKIFDQLKRIVAKEGRQADDEALKLIARRAGGSMRDSQSLLDQLLASSTGKLTVEQVNAVLGTAGDERVTELASAILARDAKTALDLIAVWVEQGLQISELVDQLVAYWRALMLVSCGGPEVRNARHAHPEGGGRRTRGEDEPRRDPRGHGSVDRDAGTHARHPAHAGAAGDGRRSALPVRRATFRRSTRAGARSAGGSRGRGARFGAGEAAGCPAGGTRGRKKKRPTEGA